MENFELYMSHEHIWKEKHHNNTCAITEFYNGLKLPLPPKYNNNLL